ncbi:MAG: hypothetical protein KAV82_16935 [Phycisphaerae bacterium]|nr:hypothetical protein [Phycisphaerae bacterium]
MTTATTSTTRPCRYQRWDGELNQGHWTWLTIVVTGVRRIAKNAKTRTLIMTSGLFVLGSCGIFYALSLLETIVGTPQAKGLYDFVRGFLGVDISSVSRLEEFRGILWRCVFLVMIKIQMFWVLFVVARVGPGLIANDLKARALPIYFAKPVAPLTYLLGKWMVVASFIAMVMLLPNLLSLLVGTLMTGGLGSWSQSLGLAWDLLVSGLGVCVLGGMIMIALSSMTSDSRYVTGAWLAVCVLLVFAQAIVNEALPGKSVQGFLGCISLRDNVLVLTDWLFGMRQAWEASSLPVEAFSEALVKPVKPLYSAVVLGGWTLAAVLFSYRQVVRFSRSAANV